MPRSDPTVFAPRHNHEPELKFKHCLRVPEWRLAVPTSIPGSGYTERDIADFANPMPALLVSVQRLGTDGLCFTKGVADCRNPTIA